MAQLTLIPKVIDTLLKGLDAWNKKAANTKEEISQRFEAIDAVLKAAISTKAYLYDLKETGNKNREREIELAHQWRIASKAIREYDYELYRISQLKSIAWADHREWDSISINPKKIKLDLIIKQCQWLQEQSK